MLLQALCNSLNKDYRSFQARFALGIHGEVAESRFASCRREEKLVEERFHVLRSRAPFLILSPSDEVSLRDATSSAFQMCAPPFRCTSRDSGETVYCESTRANRDASRNPREIPPRAVDESLRGSRRNLRG